MPKVPDVPQAHMNDMLTNPAEMAVCWPCLVVVEDVIKATRTFVAVASSGL